MKKKPPAAAPTGRPPDTVGRFQEPAAREVLKQFRILFGTVKRHYRELETSCGLGGAQLWALAEVAAAPGISIRELAHALLIHQSTASNLVNRLEKAGLLIKQADPGDQRRVRLSITAKAGRTLQAAPEPHIGVLQDALQHLPEAQLQALRIHMAALIAALRVRDVSAESQPLAHL